jgi:hypothetical protein
MLLPPLDLQMGQISRTLIPPGLCHLPHKCAAATIAAAPARTFNIIGFPDGVDKTATVMVNFLDSSVT